MFNTNFLSLLSANLTCNMFKCLCCRGSILEERKCTKTSIVQINPLSPSIHKQILQTDLHTFP